MISFLNNGPGYIVFGVRERQGRFAGFQPLDGDPDKTSVRVLSVIQDNIDPKPLSVGTETKSVEGGFLLIVAIPEHHRRPYQNKMTGAFYKRTGAKNTPVPRDTIEAMFVREDRYELELEKLTEIEKGKLRASDRMEAGGSIFEMSILPREYFDRSVPTFTRGHGLIRTIPLFYDNRVGVPQGCEGGYEALAQAFTGKVISRVFVSGRWFVHAYVVHPITSTPEGRVTIVEFRDDLLRFLKRIAEFYSDNRIKGPFCVNLEVSGLSSAKIGWVFRGTERVILPRTIISERVDDKEIAETFYRLVYEASHYG